MSSTAGHNYIVQEREFKKTRECVYKIGKTQDISTRMKAYPKESVIFCVRFSKDCHQTEKNLIESFDKKFKCRRDIGREYYSGSISVMINEFNVILNDHWRASCTKKTQNMFVKKQQKVSDELSNDLSDSSSDSD